MIWPATAFRENGQTAHVLLLLTLRMTLWTHTTPIIVAILLMISHLGVATGHILGDHRTTYKQVMVVQAEKFRI